MAGEIQAVTISSEVAALQGLSIDELRQAWRVRYGAPPYLRSGDLLRRCLAEKIQLNAYGADRDVEARLLALVRSYDRSGSVKAPMATALVGSMLLREYEGKAHRVEVLDKGFAWEGEVWRSLSQIARRITGTRWNGPAFFGLRGGEVTR